MDDKSILLDPSLDKQLKGHRGAITALYYSPNELHLASSSLDNSVLLWDLSGSLRSYRFRGHDEAVMDVTFSPTGKYMASASRDKTVRLWVPTVTGSTGMFKAHSQTVRSVQFSSDGAKLITASDDKIVKLWSSEKYKFISSFVGHTNWVRCARMSADGSIIASCSDDKSTRLWNPDSGELIHMYKDQKGHGLYVAWHPSGCYIAVGTSHGNIKLYDIRTHSLVQYYSIHNDAVTQLAFHPSGSYILSASKDGKMKILDLLEGHPIFTLTGHTGPVNAVNFSPSGESFASAGDDKLVNLWRTNFTELNDIKENVEQNPSTLPKSGSRNSKLTGASRTQGTRQWYLCYHSNKYPKANFVHLNDCQEPHSCEICEWENVLQTVHEQPVANSTMNTSCSQSDRNMGTENNSSFFQRTFHSNSTSRGMERDYPKTGGWSPECPSNNVSQPSPRSCNRPNCTNASCGIVRRESINMDTNRRDCSPQCPSHNVSHSSPPSCNRPNCTNASCGIVRRESINMDTNRRDCSPECPSNNVSHPSPRSCNRPNCTNASCGIVRQESSPNFNHESEYPSQNLGNTSLVPRLFNRGNFRIIGRESTPKPDCDLECTSNMDQANHTRCSCNNETCTNMPTPIHNPENPSHNVGHSSHIPRSCVPKPSTYNIPSFIDRTVGSESPKFEDGNLFGLVRLKQSDVCYTSGTIEWVGRKRSYPVNSGFKTLNELPCCEPKKVKRMDKAPLNKSIDNIRECDCADMLPTVNAIVDHLNALHEAVDLIDLRLNTVEDSMTKN